MNRFITFFSLMLLLASSTFSQDSYEERLNHYLDSLEIIYGDKLEDSIWNHLLVDYPDRMINATISGLAFTTIDGDPVNIDDIEGPIFLKATGYGCKPCIEEIPAINELVNTYASTFTFIFLTQETKKYAKYFRERLDDRVLIIPSTELAEIEGIVKLSSSGFDHILPFPTTYFLDSNHAIYAISSGGPIQGEFPMPNGEITKVTQEDVFRINMEKYRKLIEEGLND